MASLKGHRIAGVTLILLLSMGLIVVTAGQYQAIKKLTEYCQQLQLALEGFDNEYERDDNIKVAVAKLLAQSKEIIEDLEKTVVKQTDENETKKAEVDACQAEKNTKTDELASMEKEHNETKATFKAESEAWNQEITTLKAQLVGRSPICDYMKQDPLVVKLCGSKTSKTSPLKNTQE